MSMNARTLPRNDLKLIDDRCLVYEGPLDRGGFHGASFRTDDGMGVVVSIDPDTPAGAAFRLSITRPGYPPSDDDIAVVRIAVCGPGSHVRIVTPKRSMLRGQIVHLQEELDAYEPPDMPWWTRDEFAAVAAQTTAAMGDQAHGEHGLADLELMERRGLLRIARAVDPMRGELIQVDFRPLMWREERHRQRAATTAPAAPPQPDDKNREEHDA